MIGLHAAGITDIGQQRQGNEDSLHVGDSVFAVADGMGGHQAGEVASELALRPIAALDGRVFGDVEDARTALGDAVIEANRSVVDAAAHDRTLSGMGTTLTAALFEGRRLHVAHVGDSRAYLLRGGEVVQLTRDHTFVQQLLDDGRITPDDVATHPHRSVITRAIGARSEVEVDLQTIDLQHSDAVLLCSDGLSGVVDDEEIEALLRSDLPAVEVVTALVDAANDAGGPDNITAVLLSVVNDREDVAPYDAPTPGSHAPGDEPTTGHDVVLGGQPDDTNDALVRGTDGGVAAPEPDPPPVPLAGGDPDPDPDPGPDAAISPVDGPPPVPRAPAAAAADDGTGPPPPVAPAVRTPAAPEGSDASEGSGGSGRSDRIDVSDRSGRDPADDGRRPGPGGALVIRPDADAAAMRSLPGPGPDESVIGDSSVRRRRLGSIVVAIAIVLGLLIGGGRWLLSRSFFVGLDGDQVVIYKGVPANLGPIELSWVFEETGLSASQLPEPQLEQLQEGIAAANGTDARSIVSRAREAAANEAAENPDDIDPATGVTPTDGTGATATPPAP